MSRMSEKSSKITIKLAQNITPLPKPQKIFTEISLSGSSSTKNLSCNSFLKTQFSDDIEKFLTPSPSSKRLPTKIEKLSSYPGIVDLDSDLGKPATRKDAQDLAEWLNLMLKKALAMTENPESLYETANTIYKVCFHELIRQVSVQCKERGKIIMKIWETYLGLFEHAIRITQVKQDLMEKSHNFDKKNLKAAFERTVSELQQLNSELIKNNERLENSLKVRETALLHKQLREEKLLKTLSIFKDHYANLNEDLLNLKEENRILKIRNENLKNAIQGGYRKFKKKTQQDLIETINNDPVMKFQVEDDSETIISRIIQYQKFEESLFTTADFDEKETNTNIVEYNSTGENTDVADLCGESVGVKTRKKNISDTVVKMDSSFQSKLANESEDEIDIKIKQSRVKWLLSDISDVIFIKNISDQITKNMPNINALRRLSSRLEHAISIFKSSDNEEALTPRSAAKEVMKRKLLINIMPVEEEQEQEKNSEFELIAITTVKRIGMTPNFKLKRVMFKKMLLKLVTFFYEERIKDQEKTEFSVFVFKSLMRKYMMKKAAQNRFKHLLSSCMKFKTICRVRLFGRFLALYDYLDMTCLDLYLNSVQSLRATSGKAINNLDIAERHYTTYAKCLEYLKQLNKTIFHTDISRASGKLERIKINDEKNKTCIVDIDEFLEIILEIYSYCKQESSSFSKYLYEAGDINEDGFLQHQEYELLVRYLSNITIAQGNKLFEEYSELFLSDEKLNIKALSFDSFNQINNKFQVFSVEKAYELTMVNSDFDAHKKIIESHKNIEYKLNEIAWRMTESNEYSEYHEEVTNLIDKLRLKIYNCDKPKSVWLCLKLLEKESKRLIIQDKLHELLPKFALFSV